MAECSLAELQQGACGTVLSVHLPDGQRRRLEDLGLLPGTKICCGYSAPSGSPMAFWIKGALIALRAEDCSRITLAHGDSHED